MESFRDRKTLKWELNNLRKKSRDKINHYLDELTDGELHAAMELLITNTDNYNPNWSDFERSDKIKALSGFIAGGITEYGFSTLPPNLIDTYKKTFSEIETSYYGILDDIVQRDIDRVNMVINSTLEEE